MSFSLLMSKDWVGLMVSWERLMLCYSVIEEMMKKSNLRGVISSWRPNCVLTGNKRNLRGAGLTMGSNFGFNVSPKDTSTYEPEEPRIKPLNLRLVDDSCRPHDPWTCNNIRFMHRGRWTIRFLLKKQDKTQQTACKHSHPQPQTIKKRTSESSRVIRMLNHIPVSHLHHHHEHKSKPCDRQPRHTWSAPRGNHSGFSTRAADVVRL